MTDRSDKAAIVQGAQFAGYRAAVLGTDRTNNPFKYALRVLWEKGYDLAIEDMKEMKRR